MNNTLDKNRLIEINISIRQLHYAAHELSNILKGLTRTQPELSFRLKKEVGTRISEARNILQRIAQQ